MGKKSSILSRGFFQQAISDSHGVLWVDLFFESIKNKTCVQMKIEFQQSHNISGEFFDIFSEFYLVKRTKITSQLGMVYKTTYKNDDTTIGWSKRPCFTNITWGSLKSDLDVSIQGKTPLYLHSSSIWPFGWLWRFLGAALGTLGFRNAKSCGLSPVDYPTSQIAASSYLADPPIWS